MVCAGLVPQLTSGSTALTSIVTSRSNTAPASDVSASQRAAAASHSAPCGAAGRPRRYANVTASGAISEQGAPASMLMLHKVMRASIDSAATAGPANSMAWPVAPACPSARTTVSATSLAVTPPCSAPVKVTRKLRGRLRRKVCVASTCSTSLVPMPNASAPNAPWVEVWLSPQAMVMPGWVRPCSGATTWTMPLRGSPIAKRSIPNSAALLAST